MKFTTPKSPPGSATLECEGPDEISRSVTIDRECSIKLLVKAYRDDGWRLHSVSDVGGSPFKWLVFHKPRD